jgi:hypothetical protein
VPERNPVIILVTGLIGMVFAYLLGMQASQYGANIFVVDGVAIGMTRELAPMLVAIIMAGRSGASFTAQLGTMKLTEEIDAIRTLGLSPVAVLVVPRVLALMIAMPLLTFVGNVASIGGAILVAGPILDITPLTFSTDARRSRCATSNRTREGAGVARSRDHRLPHGHGRPPDTSAIGTSTTSTVAASSPSSDQRGVRDRAAGARPDWPRAIRSRRSRQPAGRGERGRRPRCSRSRASSRFGQFDPRWVSFAVARGCARNHRRQRHPSRSCCGRSSAAAPDGGDRAAPRPTWDGPPSARIPPRALR